MKLPADVLPPRRRGRAWSVCRRLALLGLAAAAGAGWSARPRGADLATLELEAFGTAAAALEVLREFAARDDAVGAAARAHLAQLAAR